MKSKQQIEKRLKELENKISKRYSLNDGLNKNILKALDPQVLELKVLDWVLKQKYTQAEEIFIKHFKNETGRQPTKAEFIDNKGCIAAIQEALNIKSN